MQGLKELLKRKKQKEDVLLIISIVIMVVLGISLFLPLIEFQNAEYKNAVSFVSSNPVGKSVDECVAGLGEPKYKDGTVAVYEGGHTRRFGCIYEHKEYDLVVRYDEEGCITEVKHPCKLELRKSVSSLLDLFF